MRISSFIVLTLSSTVALCTATDNVSSRTSESTSGHETSSRLVEPRADNQSTVEWIVSPKDGFNKTAIANTTDFLKQLTNQSEIWSYTNYNGKFVHWLVTANNSQVDQIRKREDVVGVEENIMLVRAAAVPIPTEPARLSEAKKAKRDIKYATQLNAGYDLRMISQPQTVPDVKDLENYVYEAKGGDGIFIYHIEDGINTKRTNEFPKDRVEVVQTPRSIARRQSPDEDGSDNSIDNGHSTRTASKAVGETYGSAKKAKLVVVKMAGLDLNECTDVFDLVYKHIDKNNRKGKAIVTLSWGTEGPVDPNNLGPTFEQMRENIKKLLDEGIPVIMAAGNFAQEKLNGQYRTNVDTAPRIFEGTDFPAIVVGMVDDAGNPDPDSQRGPHVQVWAPGVKVETQDPGSDTSTLESGTSFSAPLLAGMLATYLAYDKVPFDTAPDKLAAAAKKYLFDKANWERQPNFKVLWNEVDEAHNPKKASAATAPTYQTSGPPPATAPYAQGICGVHITQMALVYNPNGEYELEVLMTDNNHAQIGYTQPQHANATHPLQFQSKLEDLLVCVPEAQHDYIAFALGAQQWPSNGDFAQGAVPSCSVGGWDGDIQRTRQMDCIFQCTWGGGKSSDGTN